MIAKNAGQTILNPANVKLAEGAAAASSVVPSDNDLSRMGLMPKQGPAKQTEAYRASACLPSLPRNTDDETRHISLVAE